MIKCIVIGNLRGTEGVHTYLLKCWRVYAHLSECWRGTW